MSSAAIQATPHQSTTVPHPITQQHHLQIDNTRLSPHNPKDPYYNQQPSNASPSSTTRRPSRRPSGGMAHPQTLSNNLNIIPQSAVRRHLLPIIQSFECSAQASQTAALNNSPSVNPVTASMSINVVCHLSLHHEHLQINVPAAQAAASAADRSRRNEQARTASTGDGQQDRIDLEGGVKSMAMKGEIINDDAAAAAREASRRGGENNSHRKPLTPQTKQQSGTKIRRSYSG